MTNESPEILYHPIDSGSELEAGKVHAEWASVAYNNQSEEVFDALFQGPVWILQFLPEEELNGGE